MNSLLGSLGEHDRHQFMVTVSFLTGRLAERATYEWALALPASAVTGERQAIVYLLDSPEGARLKEPWCSAWRLLEEAWSSANDVDFASIHQVKRIISANDLPGSTIEKIVRLVRPQIKLGSVSAYWKAGRPVLERPRRLSDLVSVGLTSGQVVNPKELGLDRIKNVAALKELAHSLEAEVQYGMSLGRRIGWKGKARFWRLGGLNRVYFVSGLEHGDDHEPDRFHTGIAPAVKLLHTVVEQLINVDVSEAKDLADRWQVNFSDVGIRLWAAIARSPDMASGEEVGRFLLKLDRTRFWDVHDFPEIAELRARRFGDLPEKGQKTIVKRLLAGPPKSFWPKGTDAQELSGYCLYWSALESQRIKIAGHELPEKLASILQRQSETSPEIMNLQAVDDGFIDSPRATWVQPQPDSTLDVLAGIERLQAMEVALTTARRGMHDDPAQSVSDWISEGRNADLILADLEQVGDEVGRFPSVWNVFGTNHRPDNNPDALDAARRVITVMLQLPETTIEQAVYGITFWLSWWGKYVVQQPRRYELWAKVWPVAVACTNAQQPFEETPDLNVVVKSNSDEPKDLDTLNTPTGRMVGVFLAACPDLGEIPSPFQVQDDLRQMRDDVVAAGGRSRLVALHRMIEFLSYFLRADVDWTREYLIAPLRSDKADTPALWRAVSRSVRSKEVLRILGDDIAQRALDRRLGRESRKALVWALVVEAIRAKWEGEEPAVPYAEITQVLRSVEDEIRAHAGSVVRRFVADMATDTSVEQPPTAEDLFRSACQPFLESVWPQERSLATPGVARTLANLPARCGEAFVEAVDTIERFLVPFECWALFEFGFFGEEDDKPKVADIDTIDKARALIRLLDASIGTVEGAVVPFDLDVALTRVREVAPGLVNDYRFRRLAALARR